MKNSINRIKVKVKWGVLLGLLFLSWLVSISTARIANSIELTGWLRVALLVLSDVSHVLCIGLIVVTSGFVALAIARFVVKLLPGLFELDVEDEPDVITEAESIGHALDNLSQQLDDIEHNRDEAVARLQDANLLATTLVQLIRRTVQKSRELADECITLDEALTALVADDSVQLARAAGQVNDSHIRALLLERNGDERYRTSIVHLLATTAGTTKSQADALSQLSAGWVDTLTQQRSQTARLVTVIDVLDAARPITLLEQNLRTAQQFLMLQDRPDLNSVTRALPSTEATRPLLTGYK